MNRWYARELADRITNDELLQMFDNAKEGITDWKKISNVNKGLTKGMAWNILAKNFDVKTSYHALAKCNMIREFGEFLPDHLRQSKQVRKPPVQHVCHQDPDF